MYIGVDLGSTNLKAAVYDEKFNLIDRQSKPVDYIRENGFVEFDAKKYFLDLVDLLAQMLKQNNIHNVKLNIQHGHQTKNNYPTYSHW